MAKQDDIQKPVVCAKCKKVIQPNSHGFVVDYVWRDGVNLCHECNKKKGVQK